MPLTLAQKLKSIALHSHCRKVVMEPTFVPVEGQPDRMALTVPVMRIIDPDGAVHLEPLNGADCPVCLELAAQGRLKAPEGM